MKAATNQTKLYPPVNPMTNLMKTIRFRWHTAMILCLSLGLAALAARTGLNYVQASSQTPVWGTKPVLSYFLLTPDLADTMQSEVGLSPTQFQSLYKIALDESRQIQELDRGSQVILGDPSLSLAQKRTQIESSGYNSKAADITLSSEQAVQNVLDAQTYEKLVDWIESQWIVEKNLHGVLQASSGPRSYSIYATRFDTSSYTVAIPDKCIKFANGGATRCSDGYEYGQNYSVRVKYTNSVKVTVGESGPWNVDDNFWATTSDPQPRRLFTDLPLGMPESQAAYFDDYNGGKDQFGRTVTSPVAIDLADQVSIDIGLAVGKNDWVTVTYLWTDGWDSNQAQVVILEAPTKLTPSYSGDMCGSSWHKITGYGSSSAYLTLNVNDASQSTNSGEWYPNLPAAGKYKVEAFIPDHLPISWQCPTLDIPRDTGDARYTIYHANGKTNVSRNQGPLSNQWLDLGTYDFDQGTSEGVKLVDLNGENNLSHTVSFSAMKFTRILPPTPTPTPTATPTPTPTPVPGLRSGSASIAPSAGITIPVQAINLQPPGLGSASIEVQYDPAVVNATGCQANPKGNFDSGSCDMSSNHDGINPDAVRINLSSASGISGTAWLADIGFQAVGPSGGVSVLKLIPDIFAGPGNNPLNPIQANGVICIAPCSAITYLPDIFQWTRLFP